MATLASSRGRRGMDSDFTNFISLLDTFNHHGRTGEEKSQQKRLEAMWLVKGEMKPLRMSEGVTSLGKIPDNFLKNNIFTVSLCYFRQPEKLAGIYPKSTPHPPSPSSSSRRVSSIEFTVGFSCCRWLMSLLMLQISDLCSSISKQIIWWIFTESSLHIVIPVRNGK